MSPAPASAIERLLKKTSPDKGDISVAVVENKEDKREPMYTKEEAIGKKLGYDKIVSTGKATTPSDLRWPTFMMVAPFNHSFNADVPNNVWMKKQNKKIDYDKAWQQWSELYQFIAANGLVYLLPNYHGKHQDLIYVANNFLYVEPDDVVIMSNFTSEPRRGEEIEGREMLEALNYKCVDPPSDCHWEGEADLKFVRDNIYVGGYGIRSENKTFDWMEKNFKMKISRIHMTSQKNYHLDCQFSPISTDTALVCTKIMDPPDIKMVEKLVDIVDIPEKEAEAMACNIVRVGSNILVCSSVSELKESDDAYLVESSKIARLSNACAKLGLGLVVFNLSAFDVSGAALSCNVAHLNFVDYQSPNGEVF